WHFIPMDRKGVPLKELGPGESEARRPPREEPERDRREESPAGHGPRGDPRRHRGPREEVPPRPAPLLPELLREAVPGRPVGIPHRGPPPLPQLHARRREARRRHADLLRREPGPRPLRAPGGAADPGRRRGPGARPLHLALRGGSERLPVEGGRRDAGRGTGPPEGALSRPLSRRHHGRPARWRPAWKAPQI